MTQTNALSRESRPQTTRDSFDVHNSPDARFITKFENYFSIYDRYFGDFRDRPVTMIEIGVQHGGSLQMWKRYLHPGSTVVGIDIYAACKQYEEDGIRIFIGDQSDEAFLASVIEQIGQVDIVLDDGSHIPAHQIATFNYLFRHGLRDGGVYLVEDCHTSYWGRYGGGVKKRGTFIEFSKDVADRVNYWHMERPNGPRHWQTDWIESVEFYSSVVAFRKKRMTSPATVEVGGRKALNLDAPFAEGRWGKLIVALKHVPFLQTMVRKSPFLWRLMRKFMR